MRRKAVQVMLGISMCLAVAAPSSFVYAESETVEETAAEETQETTDGETESESASEEETEAESESDFIEGSAVLTDYGYEEGKLTEDGWKSSFLMMEYVPENGITMAIEDNDKLDEYYQRNGEDKMVANNEMVAMDEDGGYVQLMAEVNPNHESEEDILESFKENEGLDLSGKAKEMKIGGKTFLTSTGVIDKERYLLGVSTDQDDIALALKVKFKDSDARKAMTGCFSEIKEETDTAEETEETDASETDAAETDEVETESETETAEETEK